MDAKQREIWNAFVAKTRADRQKYQDAVDRHTSRVDQMAAANKAGLVRQAQRWLDSALTALDEIDAILAADAELTRFRGQEG